MEAKSITGYSIRKNNKRKKSSLLLEESDPRRFMLIQRRIKQKFYDRDKIMKNTIEAILTEESE